MRNIHNTIYPGRGDYRELDPVGCSAHRIRPGELNSSYKGERTNNIFSQLVAVCSYGRNFPIKCLALVLCGGYFQIIIHPLSQFLYHGYGQQHSGLEFNHE